MSGWIKLHRKLLEWEWYSKPVVKSVFIHSLLRANHKDSKWRGIEVKRGSYISSVDKLIKELGHSRQEIRTALKHLKSTNELTTSSAPQHTVFTVTGYESYQDATDELTNEQPTANQRATTNKNDKNVKNVKNKDSKAVARAKAPAKTDDSQVMAIMPLTCSKSFELKQSQTDKWEILYPAVNLKSEVSKMIGWLDANPTKRKTARGIIRFMNNWLSRAQDSGQQYHQQNQHAPQRTAVEENTFIDELNDQFERSQAAKQRREARSIK